MRYLLDSNIISDFYDKFSAAYPNISQKLASLSNSDQVSVSILILYELEYGWANAPDEKKSIIKQKIQEVQQDFEVLALSPLSAELFGLLKKALKDSRLLTKENIKKYNIDVMMAATAMTEKYILVSADTVYTDIQKLEPQLQLENWTL